MNKCQASDHPQHHPILEELQDGPNRYMFRLENHHTLKCELKARLELFGKQETCLPCEPLFCNGDIGTDDAGHRWVVFDKVFQTDEAVQTKDQEDQRR